MFLHTLPYLKREQVYTRLTFFLKQHFLKPFIVRRVASQRFVGEPSRLALLERPTFPLQGNPAEKRFVFLNREKSYRGRIAWNDPTMSKLWLYNLHYFDYLVPLCRSVSEKNFRLARELVEDWLGGNPVGRGNGWEPYPISLRLVNWIYFYQRYETFFREETDFRTRFLNSLFHQLHYLDTFLEYHLLANHLFANVKALLWGGLFFRDARRLQKGVRLLVREIEEQILSDGGHFERSPMYHSLILLDLLDLLNLILGWEGSHRQGENDFPAAEGLVKLKALLQSRAEQMLRWLEGLTHPDGQIALWNDSALNTVPSPAQIRSYFRAVVGKELNRQESEKKIANSWNASGYFIIHPEGQYLVVDGGALGPDYQPGHAHCDLLSFEYSFRDQRVVVDSGVGEYLPGDLRQRARSIYAHNTVVVNGLEQGEIWAAFRMGRRVRPTSAELQLEAERVVFRGEYRNCLFPGTDYRHHRTIELLAGKIWHIRDRVEGQNLRKVENLLHFHPDCQVKIIPAEGKGEVVCPRARILLFWNPATQTAELKEWFYVPEFGKKNLNPMLVFRPKDIKFDPMEYFLVPEIHLDFYREFRKQSKMK